MGASDAVIVARGVLTPDQGLRPATIRVVDGVIVSVDPASSADASTVVAPGFVDLQVNGVGAVDCSTATGAEWQTAADRLAPTGVTAWLPTLISQPLDRYDRALASIGEAIGAVAGPAVLGAHLEGPFLGGRPGAHRPEHLVEIDEAWLDALPDHVRLVTLGPELAGAPSAVRRLCERGIVVSLGHSSAPAEAVDRAVDAGASIVTHVFNGMPPLHHREPGLVGVALTDDRVVACLIADGVHVDPRLFGLVFRAKGPAGVILVSDAVAWEARHVASLDIRVIDGAPRLPDGTLAGSVLTLDRAVRNVVDRGVALEAALTAASTTPARAIGERDRGVLRAGARADLVVLDADDLSVTRTIVGGRVVWER